MEFVSASFFISSIVILQGGATLVDQVRRRLQALTPTHTYTHPLTLTLTHALKTSQAPEQLKPGFEKQKQ